MKREEAQTYKEYVDLARTCAQQAWITNDKDTAHQLWEMAIEYQTQAAELDGGKRPELGAPPPSLK
jgi:hypothetical protein